MKKLSLYLLLSILVLACDENQIIPTSESNLDSQGTSRGGSTAKFAIKGNILYVVDDQRLNVFDISNENESVLLSNIQIGWGVETIFPYGDKLFLGTQSGVLIFDISTPSTPSYISEYSHIVSCDPVVTDGQYAYLTLRTGSNCGRPVNELQILDMSDINNPFMIASYPMTNPKGLAIHNNTLFVCDDGIRIFDVTDKESISELEHLENIPANDVIYHNSQLLVTADDGFYQFNASDLVQLSHFTY
jgi:hypothetical protein